MEIHITLKLERRNNLVLFVQSFGWGHFGAESYDGCVCEAVEERPTILITLVDGRLGG